MSEKRPVDALAKAPAPLEAACERLAAGRFADRKS